MMARAAGRHGELFMKYVRMFLFFAGLFFSAAASASAAGAFGVELGTDIGRYMHSPEPVSERQELRMYEITPPSPDARFDTYAVDTFRGTVIRIMASSPDDATAEGTKTLEVFESLKDELIARYGTPSLCLEEVEDAGNELRGYLADEGGLEVLEWNFAVAGKDADTPGAVYVFLAGSEKENGEQASYCTLYMESADYPAISDQAERDKQ